MCSYFIQFYLFYPRKNERLLPHSSRLGLQTRCSKTTRPPRECEILRFLIQEILEQPEDVPPCPPGATAAVPAGRRRRLEPSLNVANSPPPPCPPVATAAAPAGRRRRCSMTTVAVRRQAKKMNSAPLAAGGCTRSTLPEIILSYFQRSM